MKRSRRTLGTMVAVAILTVVVPTTAMAGQRPSAGQGPTGLTTAQKHVVLGSMTDVERAELSKQFTNPHLEVLGYSQAWTSADGTTTQTVTTAAGSQTTTSKQSLDGASATAAGSTVFQGLYISITVTWDSSIHSEYRYPVTAYFDWQGATNPWSGVTGDDGLAVYWGNSLAYLGSSFWGKYRDGSNLGHVSLEAAPPNTGVGWKFWEGKNNSGSVADYGWLNITAARSNYTNFITNFSVKYIHTWQNNQYSFAWGAGPSVSFSPTQGSQAVSTATSIRT